MKLSYILAITLLIGCSAQNQGNIQIPEVSLIPGIWQTTVGQKSWKLILENGGTVSEVFRSDGMHMVISEGGTHFDLGNNSIATYSYGPCVWEYNHETNRLKVVLTIDDFFVKTTGSEISATFSDIFEGTVNDDFVWSAEWKTVTEYTSPIISQSETNPQKLTFIKIK